MCVPSHRYIALFQSILSPMLAAVLLLMGVKPDYQEICESAAFKKLLEYCSLVIIVLHTARGAAQAAETPY